MSSTITVNMPIASEMSYTDIVKTVWDSSDYNPTNTFSSLLFFCPKVIYTALTMVGYAFRRMMLWNADSALIFALHGRLSPLSTNESTLLITTLVQTLLSEDFITTYDSQHIVATCGSVTLIDQSISTIDQSSKGKSWKNALSPLFDAAWQEAHNVTSGSTLSLTITGHKLNDSHDTQPETVSSTTHTYTFTKQDKLLNASKATTLSNTPVLDFQVDGFTEAPIWLAMYAKMTQAALSALQQANIAQRSSASTAQSHVSDLKSQLSAANASKTTLQGRVSTLASQLTAANALKEELEGQISTAKGQFETSTANNEQLQTQLTEAQRQVSNLQEQLSASKSANEQLQTQLATVTKEASELKGEIQQKDAQLQHFFHSDGGSSMTDTGPQSSTGGGLLGLRYFFSGSKGSGGDNDGSGAPTGGDGGASGSSMV